MKLAIIGAGPAGIISAYNAAQNNIEVVLFEKLANVGGIWNPDSGGAYYHTKMQNSKYTFYFSEIPSESKNNFLSVKDVHSYLSNIPLGKNKNIAIRLNTSINNLKKTPEGWLLTLQCGTHITTEIFDKVIVTIGELWNPRKFSVPGIENFSGNLLTSLDYQSPIDFKDQNVLVIGGGVSGADIASDLVPYANSVTLSIKKLGLFLPREYPNGPNDLMHSYLGRYLLNNLSFNDFLNYLDKLLPDYMQIYRQSGVLPINANNNAVHVNEKIIPHIASKNIGIKPVINKVLENGSIEFSDFSYMKYDTIISCMGYEMPNYSFIEGFNRDELFEHFFWFKDPSLAILNPPVDTNGFGAAFPYFDVISRWIINVFSGKTKLPPSETMNEWCKENMSSLHVKRFYDSWLETIRIGLESNVIPDPKTDFKAYWNIITSVMRPEYLLQPPTNIDKGIMDNFFNFEHVKIRILGGFNKDILDFLLKKGDINIKEYESALHVTTEYVIDPKLLYDQKYILE